MFDEVGHQDLNLGPPDYEILNPLFLALCNLTYFDFPVPLDLIDLPVRQTNFLVLNSLSFFERSLLLMEKHQSIRLYLDQDEAGRKYTKLALKRSAHCKDESKLYKGYKDLNDWLINFGKLKMQKNVRSSMHRHL